MSHWYILDGKTPVRTDDYAAAARAMDDVEKRRVAWTDLPNGVRVSTVFLGSDYGYGRYGPPMLFETMAFPPDSWAELDCERYSTWDEAQAGHDAMVKRLLEETPA